MYRDEPIGWAGMTVPIIYPKRPEDTPLISDEILLGIRNFGKESLTVLRNRFPAEPISEYPFPKENSPELRKRIIAAIEEEQESATRERKIALTADPKYLATVMRRIHTTEQCADGLQRTLDALDGGLIPTSINQLTFTERLTILEREVARLSAILDNPTCLLPEHK